MTRRILQALVISIICLVNTGKLLAQSSSSSVSLQNLETLNVDELTDAQIQKLITQLEASGYSEQQLEVLAQSRGMSSSQIAKLRQRIEAVKSGKTTGTATSQNPNSRLRTSPDFNYNQSAAAGDRSSTFDPFSSIFPVDTLQDEDELEIFGMSFFKNSELTFDPSLNVATPKGYLIGPGDQIIIDVWGASEQNYQLEVSPDGYVVIQNIGPVYVNGMTVESAESLLKSKLKRIYSTLGSNTFAQISLGQIHTISVNVVGEVQHPGTYEISSFGTAFNALYLAGGPTEKGSFRDIQIFRGGKQVGILDAYEFLIFGEGQNVMLQDEDVLLVKPYHNRITIKGEVKRPAYYETKDQESLERALTYAGGVTANAYIKSISIRRNLDNRKTVQTVEKSFFADLILKDGDEIDVGKIQNQFVDRIRIEGAVNHPGEFQLQPDMKLSDALIQADGLRGDAFLLRGVIVRQNPDFSLTTLAFNPQLVVNGDEDVVLQSEDLIKLLSIFDLHEDYTVTIEGEVMLPGEFPYADEMTVEDLIYLANGFKESAARSFVEVARRISEKNGGDGDHSAQIFNFPISADLSISESASTFILQPFDLIVIRQSPFYEKQEVVEVEGEVQFPGKYALENKMERISDLLKRTGGLTRYAYAEGATLIRRTEYYMSQEEKEKLLELQRQQLEFQKEQQQVYGQTGTSSGANSNNMNQSMYSGLSMYDNGEDIDSRALIRRQMMEEILSKDTTANSTYFFKEQEPIGIKLDEILKNPGSKYDMILQEGDILSIPRELQTVRMRGEVLYPSTVRFDNKRTFKEYISQAGGFSDLAKKGKSYVVFANGNAQRTRTFLWFKNYPDVQPGAEVIVPKKNTQNKMTPQAWVSLTSGIATLSLVIIKILDYL